jgi:hypothetical protein
MSRKFDRRRQVEKEAAVLFHETAKRLFRPKPRWMPKAVWKLIVGIILVK